MSEIDTLAMRKLKALDESMGVPMAIYWTTEDVSDWMEEIGFPNYRACIENNFIDGRKLILLEASTLPKLGIYDFEHIKVIAARARELINLKEPIRNMKLAMMDPIIAYMEVKRRRGSHTDKMSFPTFVNKNKRWYK